MKAGNVVVGLVVLAILICVIAATPTEQKVTWLGFPVFATPYRGNDPGFYGANPPPSQLTDTGKEIGLRADGVVVWRDKIK